MISSFEVSHCLTRASVTRFFRRFPFGVSGDSAQVPLTIIKGATEKIYSVSQATFQ